MVVEASWSVPLGWFIFIVFLVIAIIYFARTRKLSVVFFIGSISMYLFSVFYLWDCFIKDKNYIFAMLLFSSIVFILFGRYVRGFSKFLSSSKNKKKFFISIFKDFRFYLILIIFLCVICLIFISSSDSGVVFKYSINDELSFVVLKSVYSGEKYVPSYSVNSNYIGNVTIYNSGLISKRVSKEFLYLVLNSQKGSNDVKGLKVFCSVLQVIDPKARADYSKGSYFNFVEVVDIPSKGNVSGRLYLNNCYVLRGGSLFSINLRDRFYDSDLSVLRGFFKVENFSANLYAIDDSVFIDHGCDYYYLERDNYFRELIESGSLSSVTSRLVKSLSVNFSFSEVS